MLNIFKNYYIMNSLESIPNDFKDFIIYNGIPFFNYYQFIKFTNLINKFISPSDLNCFNEFKEYNKEIFYEININKFFGYFDNFKNKYGFTYNLLADEDKTVINAYGVWGPKKFMGKEYDGIHRTTFVISEDGVIEDIITKVKTKAHSSQILDI